MKGTKIPHLAKKSTWERLFFYPKPLLPSNKIGKKTGSARHKTAHSGESQKYGIFTGTQRTSLVYPVTNQSNTRNTEEQY